MISSPAQLNQIFTYFPRLTELQQQQFIELEPLYREWNTKINVVSRKDIDNIYLHHVLHSLSIAKVVEFQPEAEVLDVGTGGGFPGIPLAILFPETRFHLVDSIGKKITVVQEVTEALGLKNIITEHIRAEKVKNRYDFVVTRAVARLKQLLQWSRNHIHSESKHTVFNGLLALKGGDLKEELKESRANYSLYSINDFFPDAYFEQKHVVYVPL